MSDPNYIDSLFKSAKRLTQRALRHLYFETYAPVFAKAILILTLFVIASFAGIWERIGDPFRLIAGLIALFYLGQSAWAARHKTRPSQSQARRRVEQDAGMLHRPLDTLYDNAAINSTLWSVHYEKAVQAVHRLVPSKRRAVITPLDPYCLRFILPSMLILSMMVGFGDNWERLRRSLTPSWQAGVSASNVSFEAWIDPPDYTGRPPIYFKNKQSVEIPAGSEFVARISGTKSAPRLKITGQNSTQYLNLKRIDPKTLEARTILTDKAKARWRIGSKIKNWRLDVVPDTPPTIKFEETPKADKRDRLVLNYSFEDDYGVESLELELRALTDAKNTETQKNQSVTVPLQSRSVKRAEKRQTELDLTKHIWAGEKVSAILVAKDGLGQKMRSERVYFIVPDKIFIEPLAKAIIENRHLVLNGSAPYQPLPKSFVQNTPKTLQGSEIKFDTFEPELRLNRAPKSVQKAVTLIDAVTDMPAGLFEDPAIYIGLKTVASRLRYADTQEDLTGIPQDLWAIAIRAEFGLLGTALQEMQEAEKALRDGIARRAPQREIDTLFDRYNDAVDRYMEELRKNATVSEGGAGGEGGGDPRDMAEIQELLKAIEEANRVGDTEGARKALTRLAELLERMKIELTMSPDQGEGESMPGEMSEEMLKALEEMADLLGEQRELKDETDQAQKDSEKAENDSQNNNQGENQQQGQNQGGGTSPDALAAQQRALQETLKKLSDAVDAEGLGEKSLETDGETDGEANGQANPQDEASGNGGAGETDPESETSRSINSLLEEAERAMSGSENALEGQDFEGASEAQNEAIQALRQAGRALAQSAKGNREEASADDENQNPLGQDNNGRNDDGFEANIDDRDNATRSRELLEELRRRAAEQDREKSERDYLERLLKRF